MATVLITGANKGVGLELTKLYAGRGDTVFACCRNPEASGELAAVPRDVETLQVVVGDDASVGALTERLAGRPVDLLVNNAGMLGPEVGHQTTYAMDFDGWAETFNVNTLGPVRVMQALMANLKAADASKVMTVTSQMGALSLDVVMAHAYCASKAAVNKFMRLAAIDLEKDGIAVGLVHPGWVRTDMGGPNGEISAAESAAGVASVCDRLSLANTGGFWKWTGEAHDW